MRTALLFASAGFFAGIAVALVLAMQTTAAPVSQGELSWLWPVALLGLPMDGWADGSAWHMLEFLFAFVGNGLVYAVFAGAFGALIETVRGR